MDTAKGNKWMKNPASAALRNKIKDKTSTSDKLKSGPLPKKQKKILNTEKSIKCINKIDVNKEARAGNSHPNKVSKSVPKK